MLRLSLATNRAGPRPYRCAGVADRLDRGRPGATPGQARQGGAAPPELAIGATLGIEPFVWLTDIGGLSREEAAAMMRINALRLLRAAIVENAAPGDFFGVRPVALAPAQRASLFQE